jgi:hypothetical protein
MPARTVDPCIGCRTKAEEEFILGREGINARRVFLQEKMSAQPLSSQEVFKNRIRDRFFLECFCIEIDP